ncbi:hypothetical protein ABWV16_10580 [Bacillus velezensis]|uniref:hypothetical protein n=1 Tax=Bacillus velezensis TaxID=492670 RepID=UPI003395CA54
MAMDATRQNLSCAKRGEKVNMREDTLIDEQSAYEFITWYFNKGGVPISKEEFKGYTWFYDNKNKEYVLRKKSTGQYAIPVELFDKWNEEKASEQMTRKLSDVADKIMDLRKEFYLRINDESEQTKEAIRDLGEANWKYALCNISNILFSKEDQFILTLELLDRVEDPDKKYSIGVRLFGTQYEDVKDGI